MRKLQAALWFFHADEYCAVQFHDDLMAIRAAWNARPAPETTSAALHIGFIQPDLPSLRSTLENLPGRLLLSASTVHALPAGTACSIRPLAHVEGIPFHLALDGWGYRCTDPTPSASDQDVDTTPSQSSGIRFSDWLSHLAILDPVTADLAAADGVFDEETYLAFEGALPLHLRHKLGLFRMQQKAGGRHLEPDGLLDFLFAAPPWALQLPISILNLSKRPANCLEAKEIKTLRDLSKFRAQDVLKFSALGKKSFQEINQSILALLNEGPSNPFAHSFLEHQRMGNVEDEASPLQGSFGAFTSFNMAFEHTMQLLSFRERQVFDMRTGLSGPAKTLEACGTELNVTRERVRQLEVKAIDKLKRFPVWRNEIAVRLQKLLQGRSTPLSVAELPHLDPWFEGATTPLSLFEFITSKVSEPAFHVFVHNDSTIVTLLPHLEWIEIRRTARRLIIKLGETPITRRAVRNRIDALLPDHCAELRGTLWTLVAESAAFAGDDDDAELLGAGHHTVRILLKVLMAAEKPLHHTEILQRMAAEGVSIESARVRALAQLHALRLRAGTYGLEKHIPLTAAERQLLLSETEDIIAGGATERQWHTVELCDVLRSRDLDFEGRLDAHVLNVCLRASSQLRYLGRMVWTSSLSSASGPASRLDVQQAVVSALRNAGKPLSAAEIRQRITQDRGLTHTFQIFPDGPVLRVGKGTWGLEDRDVPFSADEIANILAALSASLQQRGKGLHVSELIPAIAEHTPAAKRATDPELLLGLAQKHPGFATAYGGYLYLPEWDSPRRLTLSEAATIVLKKAGRVGLPAKEGLAQIEALIERPLIKISYAVVCSGVGAQVDKATGNWYLPPPSDTGSSDVEDASFDEVADM